MKNSRILLILFASILLMTPTARAVTLPVSSTALSSGTVSLYGTVNVSILQDGNTQGQNGQIAPLHSQGEQLFQHAKS